MSLWDALRMNMMISYQELVRTFLKQSFGDKLVDAAKSGSMDAIKSTASSALTTGLSFAFKSLLG
jgi:hypothetical protein